MKKNMLIAQSGGPTAVINSGVVGAFTAAMDLKFDNIYAAYQGIEGVLKKEIIDLKAADRKTVEGLKYTPSAGLGSCRYKMSKDITHPDFEAVFKVFEELEIGYFFYNGGNDSMDTCDKINEYAVKHGIDIKVIGIPKTVDNDLVGTDHCPGFGSAAKYLNTTLQVSAYDCYSYSTPTIIMMETMGRHAGWLAASTACAKYNGEQLVDRIYLPESVFDMDAFLADTEKLFKEKKMVFLTVSEGIKDKNGDFLLSGVSVNDNFGHAQLGGVSEFLKSRIAENITPRTKIINPNIIQRCATHVASATDMEETFNTGYMAVKSAYEGKSGYMVAYERVQNNPYVMNYKLTPLSQVANAEKTIPQEWIIDGKQMTNDIIEYTEPLMKGEVMLRHGNDGLPEFSRLPRKFITL
ncbi:MAG: 6-phosphofructokinase [Clostridia bacterium]|nr:6-phosphofructokinase [Clostridia bacterium]